MTQENTPPIISAAEVANYVVCPEAWRLKLSAKKAFVKSSEGQKIRQDWAEQQDVSYQLRKYTKIAYALLVVLVIVVFLLDRQRTEKMKRILGHAPTVETPSEKQPTPGVPQE